MPDDAAAARERDRHADYPTERERLRDIERIVITEMQLDQLSTQERRGFIYAYRSLLRGILETAGISERRQQRDVRVWALVGTLGGGLVAVIVDHLLTALTHGH